MTMRKAGILASAALAVGACVPMEQASLVYSSSHSFGVDVEAGTPQNPGLLVAIGYRDLNAAYVPVLAAKSCPPDGGQLCTDVTYHAIPISGSSKEGNESSTTSGGEISALAAAIKTRAGDIAALQSQTNQFRDKRTELTQLNARLQQLQAVQQPVPLGDPAAAPVDPGLAERTQIANRIAELTRSSTLAEITKQIADNEQRLALAEQAQASDEARLATARQIANSDVKDDAYSVFGSFNGAAGGTDKGASLQLGQTFSTGIAAQNLTQGMGRAALLDRRVQCINALSLKAGDLKPAEFADLVKKVCVAGDAEEADQVGG